jgi:hypothetical protein
VRLLGKELLVVELGEQEKAIIDGKNPRKENLERLKCDPVQHTEEEKRRGIFTDLSKCPSGDLPRRVRSYLSELKTGDLFALRGGKKNGNFSSKRCNYIDWSKH